MFDFFKILRSKRMYCQNKVEENIRIVNCLKMKEASNVIEKMEYFLPSEKQTGGGMAYNIYTFLLMDEEKRKPENDD